MAITKANARILIRQFIDDPDDTGGLWLDSRLDIVVSAVIDEMWGELLNYNSYLTSKLETLTSLTSPGYIDLRTVAAGGALAERFHRLQKITREGVEYTKESQKDILIETNEAIVAPDSRYIFFEDQLWLFPLDTATDVEIRYSYKPALFTSLGESSNVKWPEGHELAFIFRCAYVLMSKGDREDISTLKALADESWESVLDYATNRAIGPKTMYTTDSAEDYGGI